MAVTNVHSALDATDCVWPGCEKPVTELIRSPLCDRHLIKAYRQVRDLMATVGPELVESLG